MIPVHALALALVLGGAARAAGATGPAYDAKASPLDDLSRELLSGNGYELRPDGAVWDKIAAAPVGREEMPYLLSRLASARRLKALFEIHGIVNRYDSERKLSAEDRDAVRELARKNWVVFGEPIRRDVRSYFSIEEREALDKISPRFETMGPVTLPDLPVEPVTALPPAPPASAPPPPEAAPVFSASGMPSMVAPAAVSTATSTPELGVLRPWTPPSVSTAAVPAAAAAAPAVSSPTAAPAPPAPPPVPVVDQAAYDQFVAEGPYTKEGRALLELIGARGPDFCLPLLRRTVVQGAPQIVIDGSRAGAGLRGGLASDPAKMDAPPVIALSPGPVIFEFKKGLFGRGRIALLAESPQAWGELGLARPALDAFNLDAPTAATENGEWGELRVYGDGSRRGAYSREEQAGELLELLLRVGLAREGLDASPYAAARWTRAARLLFYARLKEETRQDSFLDPDRRAELNDWLDRPEEADDATAASWSGSRLQRLDPRRGPPEAARAFEARFRAACARSSIEDAFAEAARRRAARVGTIEGLLDAGLIDAQAAKTAAQAAAAEEEAAKRRALAAPACPPADAKREEGLRKAALLTAEAARAERALRERKGGDHAP